VTLRDNLERVAQLCRVLERALRELHDKVPEAAEEKHREDLGLQPELATQVRSQLLCILRDSIEPASHALERLAEECEE